MLCLTSFLLNCSGQVNTDSFHLSYVTAGAGVFYLRNPEPSQGQIEFNYYFGRIFWIFSPFTGAFFTTNTSYYLYSGISMPVDIGEKLSLRVHFAPGIYVKNDGWDLGFPLEFRSGCELSFRLKNNRMVGMAFTHVSNAGLGCHNQGIETLVFFYGIPVKQRKKQFQD